MTGPGPDLGDLLGLPPPTVRPRARTRCRACNHLVYVDQLVHGMGRCCAEKRGLIVRRWRLATTNPTDAPTLFDRPEDLMEPYPQPRIDVTGLPPEQAHTRIVAFVRELGNEASLPVAVFPAEVAEAAAAQWDGTGRVLARHAPRPAVVFPLDAPHTEPDVCRRCCTTWPCIDYRDVTAGVATGLPACRTCSTGPVRETTDTVCQACGTDYAPEARPSVSERELPPLALPKLDLGPELVPCEAAGMCPRLVSKGIKYCCGPCGAGWEATPRFEPDHTGSCDTRWAERQHLKRRPA